MGRLGLPHGPICVISLRPFQRQRRACPKPRARSQCHRARHALGFPDGLKIVDRVERLSRCVRRAILGSTGAQSTGAKGLRRAFENLVRLSARGIKTPRQQPGRGRRPCGDLNAGICLRRAALYPLSYRGAYRPFYSIVRGAARTRPREMAWGEIFVVCARTRGFARERAPEGYGTTPAPRSDDGPRRCPHDAKAAADGRIGWPRARWNDGDPAGGGRRSC